MKAGQSISDIIASGQKLFSVEFFPPKSEQGARQLLKTAKELCSCEPDFVSMTYGAGGSTRERTVEYGELLKDLFKFEVMPHLTCVGHSKDELRETLAGFQSHGFRNIMTLRGDPPKGENTFKPHPDGLAYASELVTLIKAEFPTFCLGVAGYPEKHPEAESLDQDLKHLKHKVDQGADFITTQLFFDNKDYFKFVESCRALGITAPIIPGILPALSIAQAKRFCGFCQSELPSELEKRLIEAGDDEEASEQVGRDWAYEQISELLTKGAPGVHLYILNRSDTAIHLLKRLRESKILSE